MSIFQRQPRKIIIYNGELPTPTGGRLHSEFINKLDFDDLFKRFEELEKALATAHKVFASESDQRAKDFAVLEAENTRLRELTNKPQANNVDAEKKSYVCGTCEDKREIMTLDIFEAGGHTEYRNGSWPCPDCL